jgi:hypothetical protein
MLNKTNGFRALMGLLGRVYTFVAAPGDMVARSKFEAVFKRSKFKDADLLRRYGTLEGVLASGLFPAQAEALRLYKEIATMDASAPLPSLASQAPTWGKAAALANEWGLNQLAERLGKLAETST